MKFWIQLLVFIAFLPMADGEVSRPNILFIMSDDHAATAIGTYGSRLAGLDPTPTIDRLANGGVVMENAFCNNSVCSPSRASILTGQYSHRNGVLSLGGKVAKENQTLALEMRKAGYQTAVVGKWHLNIQPLAFDYYKVLKGQGKYNDPEFFERVSPGSKETKAREEGYCSDLIASSSIEWLRNRDRTKPFMLLTHFKAPHGPWQAHERYDNLYADTKIPEPSSLYDNEKNGSIATRGHDDELLFNIGSSIGRRNAYRSQLRGLSREQRIGLSEMSDDEVKALSYQVYLKDYLRCVRGVDDNIEVLIEYLKSEGELDNTIIIYTSDQGMFLGEHDYIDKRWMYEEGMRMPFIVRYPAEIKAGTRLDTLVNNTDFLPTLLDYAGQAVPDGVQGHSFRSVMKTGIEPESWRKATYYRYWMHMKHHLNPAHFGIRTKEWKLIFFYGASENPKAGADRTPPGWELYDLRNDPLEMNNLYGNPEYGTVVNVLKELLVETRKEVGDSDEGYPHISRIIRKHWDGGEEEAVRISNTVRQNPIPKNKDKGK